MNLIDVLQEAKLLNDGERPHSMGGRSEFVAYSDEGVPLGFYIKAYKVDQFTGTAAFLAFSRGMTQEEIDQTEMRGSSGSPLATTVGKELAKLEGGR